MERTKTNNKGKSTTTDSTIYGVAVAQIKGTFTVDYEGDKFVFLTTKVKNDPNSKYYDLVSVRVPNELYDEIPKLENILLTCNVSTFYDKSKQTVNTTFTAVRYTLN